MVVFMGVTLPLLFRADHGPLSGLNRNQAKANQSNKQPSTRLSATEIGLLATAYLALPEHQNSDPNDSRRDDG